VTASFQCPGDATVSEYTVTCSVTIQTLDSTSWTDSFTADDLAQIVEAALVLWAVIFVYQMCKKVLE